MLDESPELRPPLALFTKKERTLTVMKGSILRFAMAALLSFVLFAMSILSVACGPPSKKTIEKLHAGAQIVLAQTEVNETLPDQLLAEKIITPEQYVTVRQIVAQVKTGAGAVERGLAVALTAEKPSLKDLAPIVADILAQLRTLNAMVKSDLVQRFFAAAEIGLRVLGSYFALQISQARSAGFSDVQICERVGLPYDKGRFALLATAYDGSRFDEWAAAL
jgi:hypothetical protein